MIRKELVATIVTAITVALGALLLPVTAAVAEEGASAMEQGKALAFDRKKGNCLACHMIATGDLPGNIGPPLVAMSVRYPDKARLRAQIWFSPAPWPTNTCPRLMPYTSVAAFPKPMPANWKPIRIIATRSNRWPGTACPSTPSAAALCIWAKPCTWKRERFK